ncbi:MAG: hypothetical protein M0R06_00585 [Sphaerochaeta sp.]|nr:hypothetical protein [Sphaerochaeta sp.]
MTLSSYALVTLNQAKAMLQLDQLAALHIDAEYVGTGDGTETVFTLDHTPLTGSLKVYVDSTLKTEVTHFTYSAATITFTTAGKPGNGKIVTAAYDYAPTADTFESYDDDLLATLINTATVEAERYCGRCFMPQTLTESHWGRDTETLNLYRQPVISITSVAYKVVETGTGDASTVDFTLSDTPMTDTLTVYADGVLQTVTTHYTLSGAVVTFVSAPADAVKLVFKFSIELFLGVDYTDKSAIGRLTDHDFSSAYEYVVIYMAGYYGSGATQAQVQALVPAAVQAVLTAVATWWDNRGKEATGLPDASKKLLDTLKVSVI